MIIGLIVNTPHGRRVRFGTLEEAEQLGATKINRRMYDATKIMEPAGDDDDDIPVAPIYETKVMAAETPKRRGRPKKVAE